MSAQPIGPGSIVVCTSTSQNELGHLNPQYRLTMGALYRVQYVAIPWRRPCIIDGCDYGLTLQGKTLVNQFGLCLGYCPSQFRPLNDGDTSLVENETTDDNSADGSGLQI